MYDGAATTDQQRQNYKNYQKEAQIISIRGTESIVQVGVPQLEANFSNISMNERSQTYYQIQSFKCDTNFDNIFPGDAIGLKFILQFTQIPFDENVPIRPPELPRIPGEAGWEFNVIPPDDQTLILPLSLGPAASLLPQEQFQSVEMQQSLAGDELIHYLNSYLAGLAVQYEYRQIELGVALTANQQNLIYFGQQCRFIYDGDSGKYGVERISNVSVYTYIEYIAGQGCIFQDIGGALDNGETLYRPGAAQGQIIPRFLLANIRVDITTVAQQSDRVQRRLAKYFALDQISTIPNTVQYKTTFNFGEPSSNASIAAGLTGEFKNGEFIPVTNHENIRDMWYTRFLMPALINGGLLESGTTQVKLSRYVMNESAFDWIYIRTTLNTNFWNKDGSRSDILQIVPVYQSYTDIGTQMKHETRVYQAKDDGFNTFTIRFTDETGTLLSFNDDYILNIAVFFGQQ